MVGGKLALADVLAHFLDPIEVIVIVRGEVEHPIVVNEGLLDRAHVEDQCDPLAGRNRRASMIDIHELGQRGVSDLMRHGNDVASGYLPPLVDDRLTDLAIASVDLQLAALQVLVHVKRNQFRHRHTIAVPINRVLLIGHAHECDGRTHD